MADTFSCAILYMFVQAESVISGPGGAAPAMVPAKTGGVQV